jgi:hypothetical protein
VLWDSDADPDAFLVPAAEDPDGLPVAPAEDPVLWLWPAPVPVPVPVPVVWSELVRVCVTDGAAVFSVESEFSNVDALSCVVENNAPVASAPEDPELGAPELEGDTDAMKRELLAVLFYIQAATQSM